MTHAEAVQQAKDALVEAACTYRDSWDRAARTDVLGAVDAYRALLAATCPTCGGTGEDADEYIRCTANCDNGRKRDE